MQQRQTLYKCTSSRSPLSSGISVQTAFGTLGAAGAIVCLKLGALARLSIVFLPSSLLVFSGVSHQIEQFINSLQEQEQVIPPISSQFKSQERARSVLGPRVRRHSRAEATQDTRPLPHLGHGCPGLLQSRALVYVFLIGENHQIPCPVCHRAGRSPPRDDVSGS